MSFKQKHSNFLFRVTFFTKSFFSHTSVYNTSGVSVLLDYLLVTP